MARKRIFNPISEARKEIILDCAETKKDELFDLEECMNYIESKQKLSRHSEDSLPEGPVKFSMKKEEHKIYIDLGVDVRRSYIKQLLRKYLHKKGLKDWIYIRAEEDTSFKLHYYNMIAE